MPKVTEKVKEKAAAATAEIKEVLHTTKANLKVATAAVLHPFDKDKKAQAKEEANAMKVDAAVEKAATKEDAEQKAAVRSGEATAGSTTGGVRVARSDSSSSSSSSDSDSDSGMDVEPALVGGTTSPTAHTETPVDPTQPVFMVGR